MSLKKAEIKTLREYFSSTGDGYYIPDYQRDYSWTDTELSDFWKSLTETENEEYHFFGQIVIHDDSGSNKKFIIDGQQRTMTSIIFLVTLKMLFDDLKDRCDTDNGDEHTIYNDADFYYTTINGFIKRRVRYSINLENADKNFFEKLLNFKKGEQFKKGEEKRKSQTYMRKAYEFFVDQTKKAVANKSLDEECEKYKTLCDTLIDKFQILYVEATEIEEAFVIFETLNATGKDLEIADLLKNYFFSKIQESEKCKNDWNYIDSAVGSDKTEYIRCFINSREPFSTKKELYRRIKKDIATNKSSCKKLLADLKQYSDEFQLVSNPELDDGNEKKELIASLKALKIFRARTFYPIFLAMKQVKFKDDEITKVISKIETLIFRNIKICGLNPNIYEKRFAELARNIYNMVYGKKADGICKEIKELMAPNKVFKSTFENLTLSKSNNDLIRYIFRKIHNYLDPKHEINVDNNDVHIEHIMPQEKKRWKVTAKEHKALLWRLGNMALLAKKLNKSISNKPFLDKRHVYESSKVEPNKEIAKFKKWDRKAINARQKKLAEYAVKIWE